MRYRQKEQLLFFFFTISVSTAVTELHHARFLLRLATQYIAGNARKAKCQEKKEKPRAIVHPFFLYDTVFFFFCLRKKKNLFSTTLKASKVLFFFFWFLFLYSLSPSFTFAYLFYSL